MRYYHYQMPTLRDIWPLFHFWEYFYKTEYNCVYINDCLKHRHRKLSMRLLQSYWPLFATKQLLWTCVMSISKSITARDVELSMKTCRHVIVYTWIFWCILEIDLHSYRPWFIDEIVFVDLCRVQLQNFDRLGNEAICNHLCGM